MQDYNYVTCDWMTATSDLATGYSSNVSKGFCDQVYVAATALTTFSRC